MNVKRVLSSRLILTAPLILTLVAACGYQGTAAVHAADTGHAVQSNGERLTSPTARPDVGGGTTVPGKYPLPLTIPGARASAGDASTYINSLMYATVDTDPTTAVVTKAQALADFSRNSYFAADAVNVTPSVYLGLFTDLNEVNPSASIRSRPAWIVTVSGGSVTEPDSGVTKSSCTSYYVVDAKAGAPLLDVSRCAS